MAWNLFLAFVPWLLSSFLYFHKIKKNLLCALIIFVWMLFFPNAPYVLTDLLHLRKDLSVPVWYDFIMLLSYAFTGLLYAFVSLNFIEVRLNEIRVVLRCIHRPLFALEQLGRVCKSRFAFRRRIRTHSQSRPALVRMAVYLFARYPFEPRICRV